MTNFNPYAPEQRKLSMTRIQTIAAAATLMLLASACRDDRRDQVTGPVDVTGVVPFGFVQPVLVREPGAKPGESVIVVHVVGGTIGLGSYQGSISFDPAALTVVSIATPEHDGEFRVVNDENAATGRIRFAAFTAEKLSDDVALRITVRQTGTWEAAALRASLEVVGDNGGAAIAETALKLGGSLLDGRTGANLTP